MSDWHSMNSAPRDGTLVLAVSWHMHDVPGGPYPKYHIASWDALEGSGWLEQDGLDEIPSRLACWTAIDEPPAEPSP